MDRRWKRRGVEQAALPERAEVLDLASGTGDFSQLVAGALPAGHVHRGGSYRAHAEAGAPSAASATPCAPMPPSFPSPKHTFDCVFIGYGLRNFPDLNAALREIERVTRPGGLLVTLDFFLPANPVLRQLYIGYLYAQGGFWGLLLHGRPRIYTYIPDSLRSFVSIAGFTDRLRSFGYGVVKARGFILGGIGLHWAAKNGAR